MRHECGFDRTEYLGTILLLNERIDLMATQAGDDPQKLQRERDEARGIAVRLASIGLNEDWRFLNGVQPDLVGTLVAWGLSIDQSDCHSVRNPVNAMDH